MKVLVAFTALANLVHSRCFDPSPAFPPPNLDPNKPILKHATDSIEKSVRAIIDDDSFNASSFSIEITSASKTLWEMHRTAPERDSSRPGADVVTGDSAYRIASITKAFTTLGLIYEHAKGTLQFDDTVDMYIEELTAPDKGKMPWKDISLRDLATQMSGLPRDVCQSDLADELESLAARGFPPNSRSNASSGDKNSGFRRACSRKEMLDSLKRREPLFAPNQQSTYSNVNFNLLGLVLENVTGQSYSSLMQKAIFEPLELNNTSLEKPKDSKAVIPKGKHFWDVEQGVQRPTGGIYSTSADMSRFLRYVLTHYNGLHATWNWYQPASFSTGMNTFFGMPWEIFRTDKILHGSSRPVTFITKSGGVPYYFSIIIMIPEYQVGVTILVAGKGNLVSKLREAVTIPLVRALDQLAFEKALLKYAGTYDAHDSHINSSLTIAGDPTRGLYVSQLISNGTDVLSWLIPPDEESTKLYAKIVPTLLYKNETEKQGERWRALMLSDRDHDREAESRSIWDDMCVTNVDIGLYAGRPINEAVFWTDQDDTLAVKAELTGFQVTLKRVAAPTPGGMSTVLGNGQSVLIV